MSQEYDNTNRGAMFKNDLEGKSANFPPYGGSLNVGGVDYWVSAWIKEGAKGKFFSLQVKPKEERQSQGNGSPRSNAPRPQRQAPAQSGGFDDFEDSTIPF